MINILGGTERDDERFHYTTQDSVQFKTYELFILEIFPLIFLGHSGLQVTETAERETTDKEELLYLNKTG